MYIRVKRVLDFILAGLIGLVFLPFGLVIAMLIRLDSKGSVFFKQKRAGKDGQIFYIIKFRTMRIETQREGAPLADDDRLTRVGRILRRLSLDEVPQIVNILKGEMSVIGPRPLVDWYVPRYSTFQARRHEVLPGITGWAQVNGRNAISWDEKFEYDVWYVDHMSFVLDVRIFFKTIRLVLAGRGVSSKDGGIMEEFWGDIAHQQKQGDRKL